MLSHVSIPPAAGGVQWARPAPGRPPAPGRGRVHGAARAPALHLRHAAPRPRQAEVRAAARGLRGLAARDLALRHHAAAAQGAAGTPGVGAAAADAGGGSAPGGGHRLHHVLQLGLRPPDPARARARAEKGD